jgi:hypothetical protein
MRYWKRNPTHIKMFVLQERPIGDRLDTFVVEICQTINLVFSLHGFV